jgi:ribosomal protein S18 acetylase RimI-like enzyme
MSHLESVDATLADDRPGLDPEPADHPLDYAAWASLTGPHAKFAQGVGRALRYPSDVSPVMAIPPRPDRQVWDDLLALVGPGAQVVLASDIAGLPAGWEIEFQGGGVQMVSTRDLGEPDADILTLGAADADEMLALVGRAQPGPFEAKTYQLGSYFGVRHNGALIAMAGERLHPPGWTEVSAVCTDAEYRGQGLGTRLVRAVTHNIRQRGETPFLHAAQTNVNAIRLYESLGFEIRRVVTFTALRSPAANAQVSLS